MCFCKIKNIYMVAKNNDKFFAKELIHSNFFEKLIIYTF